MNPIDNDSPVRNAIEPADGTTDMSDAPTRSPSGQPGQGFDRGMPSLGQYRSARPRAWWLTPLAVILIAGAGGVWTVHGFLAQHDAQAKAKRDAAESSSTQGRVFKDQPASGVAPASGGASAVAPASAPTLTSAPIPVHSMAAGTNLAAPRSYYDAPLVETDGGAQAGGALGLPGGTGMAANLVGAASAAAARAGGALAKLDDSGPLAQALTPTATPRVRAGTLGNRSLVLAQGAKIDCVGDTAFDSTDAGMSTCTVAKNVYSDDGRVVLVERGSQIISQYRTNLSPGQKRTFILAARIETTQGVTVEIDSPAADALGRMGIDGEINNHWGQRIGAAMLLGLTQDAIGYLATRGGNGNSSTVFESTQQQGNDMATRVLDSTINIPPTLTKNQGAEFTIVVARDLDFGTVYALQPEARP